MPVVVRDIVGPHRAVFNIPLQVKTDPTEEHPIFVAPFACRIRSVYTVAGAAITGTATTYKNLNLKNRGTDGSGTTELANRDYLLATNSVKGKPESLYAPGTPLDVAAGTVLAIEVEQVSTGLALPPFGGYVEYDSVYAG